MIMINWSKGVVARYYSTIVDSSTWNDIGDLKITGGTIKYSDSGERASADVQCVDFNRDEEYWIRLYCIAKQGSEIDRVPLFTGVVSIPDVTYKGRYASSSLQCYSALSIADKIYLPLGWHAVYGANGAKTISDLLTEYIPAPVVIDDYDDVPFLTQRIIAEQSETVMTMVDKILNIINWRIAIDGDGTIHIAPPAEEISATFDYNTNDIFELDVTVSDDWYNIPNVYRAVGSGISGIAKDEDPASKFSIVNRGREIWKNETGCSLSNGETIGEYALRKLKEAQNAHKTIDYTRRFDPNVRVSDKVKINYFGQDVSGIYKVKSQSITFGYGGKVSEQVEGI